MSFSKKDKEFMKIAIKEAKSTFKKGNFPIGAVLVINGKLIGSEKNRLYSRKDWFSHAENNLLQKYSKLILKESGKGSITELFTTLEPCLMCFGSSVLHGISRIIFACPDPYGGVTNLNKKMFTKFYRDRWPKINGGLLKKESHKLMMKFLGSKDTVDIKEILEVYKKIKF